MHLYLRASEGLYGEEPVFQQVVRQGLSIHIMWISVPPFSFGMG